MNKLIHLFLLDTKLLLKSKVFYFKLVLFPIVMILILGSVFSSSSKTILNSFDVAYYSDDSPVIAGKESLNLSQTLKYSVFKSKDVKEIINLKEVNSYEEGKKLVSDGKAVALVYVPPNFTKNYLNGNKVNISVLGDNNKSDYVSIVKTIINSFNKNISTIRVEQKEIIDELALNKTDVTEDKVNKLINDIQTTGNSSHEILKVSTSSNAKPIGIMEYESIAMVVMFSILTAFELAHSIVNDKLNNTMARIKSMPTTNLQYILGKVLGVVFAITVQMTTVIVISRIAFRIKFGNIFEMLLVTIVYSFTIGMIVFCAGALAKDQMSISSFATPILWGFSFLGGSLVSKDSFPDSLATIQKLIPNGKAINCYLKVCQGKGISDIYVDLLELVAIALVFLIISLLMLNEGKLKNVNKKDTLALKNNAI